MRPDVYDLKAFYGTRQGQLVRRLLGREIRNFWPDLTGQRVLGLGYASPFMGPLAASAERVAAVMPPDQGVMRWPSDEPNLVALGAEDDLPIADRSIDKVLLVHALESTEKVQRLLREVWRVLADGGEAIIVVPNRRGLWCLSEATPFGQGRPFSSTQLKQLLRNNLFTPQKTGFALFVPPFRSSLLLRTAVAWERVGLRFAHRFSGVVMMLAQKQIYVAPANPSTERVKSRRYVPMPAAVAAERIAAERIGEPPQLPANAERKRGGLEGTAPAR